MSHSAAAMGDRVDGNAEPQGGDSSRLDALRHSIEHAAHLLPSQGPITSFVHHNTLHAFEHVPFECGLREGMKTHGCEVFLSEEHYQGCLVSGRIRQDELSAVLADDLGESAGRMLGFLGTRFRLRMSMLEHPLQFASPAQLRWAIAETDALKKFRSFVDGPTRLRMVAETRHWVMRDLRNGHGKGKDADPAVARVRDHVRELFTLFDKTAIERWEGADWESFCLHLLWRICLAGSEDVEAGKFRKRPPPIRHGRLLEEVTNQPCDQLVHDVLIRFCAAFLDQGYADWRLPDRDRGFWQSFAELYRQKPGVPERWMRGLRRELERLVSGGIGPLQSIDESLQLLGVADDERDEFILATLEALPGWAGMIWQMETNAEWTLFPAPAGSLTEYLAVRLILDRLAARHVARRAVGWRGELKDLRRELVARLPADEPRGAEQHASLAFQLAQVHGWLPQELARMSTQTWNLLFRELDEFDNFERRRILHRAYERRYRNLALDAISLHCRQRHPWAHESSIQREHAPAWGPFPRLANVSGRGASAASGSARTPVFQLICCIDDREESFRRHIEEIEPACETFSEAGFFGVAMYYRGASDAHSRPLCPVVIKPRHYVVEEVAYTFVKEHRRRAETRRVLGAASHQVHHGSRTFLGGFVTALGGTLASIPMVARILFPRATAQIRRLCGGLVRPPVVTQLVLERSEPDPGPSADQIGYSLAEMVAIVERLLRDIGLTEHFAPIVMLFGHGSSSLNNPHESAYNCGACSGGRGGPNARAFAQMANDSRVRELLVQRGLNIPAETTFVGGYHNTCDDSVTFYDLDRLPARHRQRFEEFCNVIDEARGRNAHERCRRFESAPLSLSFEGALRHVEGRSEDLSEARPEYNHATNAICMVGHRWWTRNLFLDRRAFLQSYDPRQDDAECTILARILAAVIPVCAGISLEYYFSCVDTGILGCGSKLPHNITSLLGVMEGAASDLRPGLSQQMIEIHEPMRILFVIETSPEGMLSIMERNPVIGRLCRNEWVQLAVLDSETGVLQTFQDGEFRLYRPRTETLPTASTSADWYRGCRDHLGCCAMDEQPAT